MNSMPKPKQTQRAPLREILWSFLRSLKAACCRTDFPQLLLAGVEMIDSLLNYRTAQRVVTGQCGKKCGGPLCVCVCVSVAFLYFSGQWCIFAFPAEASSSVSTLTSLMATAEDGGGERKRWKGERERRKRRGRDKEEGMKKQWGRKWEQLQSVQKKPQDTRPLKSI